MSSDPKTPIISCIISFTRTNPANADNVRRKSRPITRRWRTPSPSAAGSSSVGHGEGKSNAAHHLTEYLQKHRRETCQRIASEVSADLSRITLPQLLELARQALRQ